MCQYETIMPVYITHMNSLQSTVQLGALLYIHLTLLAYTHTFHTIGICPWTNMPATLYMSHHINTVIYMQTLHYYTY